MLADATIPPGASRPTGDAQPSATGSSSRPRNVRRPFHFGSSAASSIAGNRATSVPSAIAALEPGQRGAEAVVDPAAEREVLRRAGAGEVERVGVVAPVRGVVVGRRRAR